MPAPSLETERLRLVPPSLDAEPAYQRFYTDAVASKDYGGPLTPQQAFARLMADAGSWELQGFGVWIVRRKVDDAVLGTCGFWQGKDWPRELTWWLFPEGRGAGFAKEASIASLRHASDVFGWPEVQTYMNDTNEAARALVLRLGGVPAGRQRFPDGLERTLYRLPRPS